MDENTEVLCVVMVQDCSGHLGCPHNPHGACNLPGKHCHLRITHFQQEKVILDGAYSHPCYSRAGVKAAFHLAVTEGVAPHWLWEGVEVQTNYLEMPMEFTGVEEVYYATWRSKAN